jgi:hypothetical protein
VSAAGTAYSNWKTLLYKEGYAPKVGTQSREATEEEVNYYQYRIQSWGYSQANVTRKVEVLVRVMQIEHTGGAGYRRIAHRY